MVLKQAIKTITNKLIPLCAVGLTSAFGLANCSAPSRPTSAVAAENMDADMSLTSLAQIIEASGDVLRPDLGPEAPEIIVAYTPRDFSNLSAGSVRLYLASASDWRLIYTGPYNRYSDRVSRGKSYHHVMVSDSLPHAVLSYEDGNIRITSKDEIIFNQPVE